MKHLRKFNESKYDDMQQEIDYTIGFVVDKLGDPTIKRERWGDEMKFTYTWELGITIRHLNKAEVLINKLKDIMEEIDDIIAAKDRLPSYDIYMSLDTKITLVFIPNKETDSNYKFIIGQNGRQIQLKRSEIERFFRNKGSIVVNIEEDFDELSDIGSILLVIDKKDSSITSEFRDLLLSEMEDNEDIDTDLSINYGSSSVSIYPESEKRFITLG